jgi:signal transduction histidine kinase
VPLVARGHSIGVLSLMTEQAGVQYIPDDLNLAEELARRLALAIDNAFLHEAAQQAQAQAEATLQAHNQLLHLITHDLRSPLAVMQGYVYLMRKHITAQELPDTNQLEHDVHQMEDAIARVNGQIGELVDVAELKAGQPLALRWEAVDLIKLVQHTVEACQQLSEEHQLVIETAEEQLVCAGDGLRLERVLTNLLTNAITYSPQGGEVLVTVQAAACKGQSGASISVRDQGIGIPEVDLPHLFEPFRRGSNVIHNLRGSGLGLASVQSIVAQHGGTISVQSKEAIGSTFTLWLPIDTESAQALETKTMAR